MGWFSKISLGSVGPMSKDIGMYTSTPYFFYWLYTDILSIIFQMRFYGLFSMICIHNLNANVIWPHLRSSIINAKTSICDEKVANIFFFRFSSDFSEHLVKRCFDYIETFFISFGILSFRNNNSNWSNGTIFVHSDNCWY